MPSAGSSKIVQENDEETDFSPQDVVSTGSGEDYSQISQELRIQSPLDGTFSYIGGIFVQRGDLDLDVDAAFRLASIVQPILPIPALVQQIRDREGSRYTDFEQTTILHAI